MAETEHLQTVGRERVVVLIPAWQPERALVDVVRGLVAGGVGRVVVVDDGSRSECAEVFRDTAAVEHVMVLRHAINLGKGRALKTGMNYVLAECADAVGVVTADADGQHTVGDILRVADALAASPQQAVLGVRVFGESTPLRSKFGNELTKIVFKAMTGTRVGDTQTGLRGLPMGRLAELMQLEGERYEYEMTMLVELCRRGRRPVEVPIETVYIDNNRGSHFDPVRDSMRIYFVLLRFYFSSVIAAGLDFVGFSVTMAATGNLEASVAVGRLSSLVNFLLNRRFVFHKQGGVTTALWRYYLLVAAIGVLSYGLTRGTVRLTHWNVFAAKATVDALLSLVSFSVQRTFVFGGEDEA